MRKPWDFLPRASEVFCQPSQPRGQIKAGGVIMSLPTSVGIGRNGLGIGWDVGLAGSEAK